MMALTVTINQILILLLGARPPLRIPFDPHSLTKTHAFKRTFPSSFYKLIFVATFKQCFRLTLGGLQDLMLTRKIATVAEAAPRHNAMLSRTIQEEATSHLLLVNR